MNARKTFDNIVASYELDGKKRPAAIALAIKQHPQAYRAACEERARTTPTSQTTQSSSAAKKFPSTGSFDDLVKEVMTTKHLSRPKAAAFVAQNFPTEYAAHCRQRLARK